MVSERVSAAVVGVGIWGQNHALVYNDYHRSQLVCVCDQDEARAKEIAARFGCDYTTDLHEIARSSDIEAVSIATPDFAHFAPAMTMSPSWQARSDRKAPGNRPRRGNRTGEGSTHQQRQDDGRLR